jgi:hypothetical protein
MKRVLALVGIVLFAAAASGAYFIFDRTPEGPEQPIAFYHKVHAGDNQIPCMYCHTNADKSPSAGVPSVKVCVGCHIAGSASMEPAKVQQLTYPVKGGGGPERPDWWYAEANKLLGYWQRQEAIPWVRIHQLPAHAKFPHDMHVNAGLQCQTCHGPVQEMEKVYQFSSLQMGWCIDCHRGDTPLSPAEQESVEKRSSYVRKLAALEAAGHDVEANKKRWPKQRASTDCVVCHY